MLDDSDNADMPVLVVCSGDLRCQDRSRADELQAALVVTARSGAGTIYS